MNVFPITNSDDELLGIFQSESEPQYIEDEIEKVYQEWIKYTDECEVEDMVFLGDYLKTHLPNIGVYPMEVWDVQLSGG